jgi:hypothetical protein
VVAIHILVCKRLNKASYSLDVRPAALTELRISIFYVDICYQKSLSLKTQLDHCTALSYLSCYFLAVYWHY